MGLFKNKMINKELGHYEDSSSAVALDGGYLAVQIDGVTVGTVSVPRPYLMADRDTDSVALWSEEIEDDEGNIYQAEVMSSISGVSWSIDIEPNKREDMSSEEILNDLDRRIEIKMIFTDEG